MGMIVDVLPSGSGHVLDWTDFWLNPFQKLFDLFSGSTGYVWAGFVIGAAILGFLIKRR